MTTHDITWELIFRLIRCPQPTENTVPVAMSSEPPSKKQKTNESEGTFPGFATTVIHAGQNPDQWASKSVVPLISLSTTYKQDETARPVRNKICPSTNDKPFLLPCM